MKLLLRAGLVAVVAAAVIVPTAVIGPAPPTGQAFSVQQVLRVFGAAGLPLQRDAEYDPAALFETFEASPSELDLFLSVQVWRPGFSPPTQGIFAELGPPPRFAHRGNVYVVLSGPGSSSRTWEAARTALRLLRYSPADAARPQLPTFVLRPGEQRTLSEREAPNGSEVDCANGGLVGRAGHPQPAVASTGVTANTRSSAAFTSSTSEMQNGERKSARLDWSPLGGGTALEFSCSGKRRAGGLPGLASGSSQVVVSVGGGKVYPEAPPEASVPTGPLPPLKLERPTVTLRNEYAKVSAQTRQAMLGAR